MSTWLAAQSSSLMVVTLSLMASNVKGNTKKAAAGTVYFVGYSTGCIVGPQLWQAPDAPRYIKGCIPSVVSWALLILFFGVYYLLFRGENARREANRTVDGAGKGEELYVDSGINLSIWEGQIECSIWRYF